MYKISLYVPKSHVERVKEAMFAQGAGRFMHYDRCSWQVLVWVASCFYAIRNAARLGFGRCLPMSRSIDWPGVL